MKPTNKHDLLHVLLLNNRSFNKNYFLVAIFCATVLLPASHAFALQIAPSDFRYSPKIHEVAYEVIGQTLPPSISWNSRPGAFRFITEVPKNISLDVKTGVVKWDKGLQPGKYHFIIEAYNKGGTATATLSVIRDKRPVVTPTFFEYYPPKRVAPAGVAGQSLPPKLPRDVNVGTFAFEKELSPEITIDKLTGIIRWTADVAPGVYKFKVLRKEKYATAKANYFLSISKKIATSRGIQFQLAPNPTASDIVIRYYLEHPQRVRFDLFSETGQLLETLLPPTLQPKGQHELQRSLSNLPRGLLWCRMQTETSGSKTLKLVIDK